MTYYHVPVSLTYNYSISAFTVLCSRFADCTNFYTETSTLSCCSTEGVYTYISDIQCRLCYGRIEYYQKVLLIDVSATLAAEYGWVQDISQDRQSAVPQVHIDAVEGDIIPLNIFFFQNGPSSTDYILFTITTGGTAIGMF